jgi:hypothetical protein
MENIMWLVEVQVLLVQGLEHNLGARVVVAFPIRVILARTHQVQAGQTLAAAEGLEIVEVWL